MNHNPSDPPIPLYAKSLDSGPRIDQRDRLEPFISGQQALSRATVTPFSPGQASGPAMGWSLGPLTGEEVGGKTSGVSEWEEVRVRRWDLGERGETKGKEEKSQWGTKR